jgi:hypothetical protein
MVRQHIPMKTKIITIIVMLTLLFCCTKKMDENIFSQLPHISLPFTGSSKQDLQPVELSKEYNHLSTIYPNNLKFVGVLAVRDTFTAILLVNTYADDQIPYLFTYTSKGEKIDSIELIQISVNEDVTYWGAANYVISENLMVSLYDSSSTYQRDNKGEIMKETIKPETHKLFYKITSNGNIQGYPNHFKK